VGESRHTPLVYDIDTAGAVTICRYDPATKRKAEVLATLTGPEEDAATIDLALLFEAAPDLLAVAEAAAVGECANRPSGCRPNEYPAMCLACLARAAIARAEGRQP